MKKVKEKKNPQKYATLKFTSLKSAEGFKEKVKTESLVKKYADGSYGVRFKIDKSIPKSQKRTERIEKYNNLKNDPTDFDSEINGYGTRWHTAEDF